MSPAVSMNTRRICLINRFGLTATSSHWDVALSEAVLNQVDHCADDSARRLILGVSQKEEA